jgi:AcrR family transcriptional regulator
VHLRGTDPGMSPRRTDTRERAVAVALELFNDKGYEQTALREVAERLGITKAALYYHFPSKEALLEAVVDSQQREPVEELLRWVDDQPQPQSTEVRREVLRRITELLQGRLGPWLRFAQNNQRTLEKHPDITKRFRDSLLSLVRVGLAGSSDLHGQVRSLLALLAIYLGNLGTMYDVLGVLGIDVTAAEFAQATMDVAMELVEQH